VPRKFLLPARYRYTNAFAELRYRHVRIREEEFLFVASSTVLIACHAAQD